MMAILQMRRRPFVWIGFYALCLLCWAGLMAMQLPAELLAARDIYGADFWIALCATDAGVAGWPRLFAMWMLMAGAMMAPTFVPTLATYDDLVQGGAARGFGGLLAGYFAIWVGFAAVAALAQSGLVKLGLLDPLGQSMNAALTVGLLAGAVAYQFSAFKESCLSQCRRPMAFLMQHWAEGPLRMGVRLGVMCLGCCWALMTLAFVGGTMNLLWMGLGMVLMTLEKLPDLGNRLTRPLGFALLTAAALVGLNTIVNGGLVG